MTDIRRSLEAMEIDEDMRVVLMRSKYFNAFCMGTDLKSLYYYKQNGEYEKIDKYLEKLYNFNHFISIYHKPILGVCTGQASKK
jgi:enoyl-CoA hydratase/carnithine racemase